jgi:hypothetical protein
MRVKSTHDILSIGMFLVYTGIRYSKLFENYISGGNGSKTSFREVLIGN